MSGSSDQDHKQQTSLNRTTGLMIVAGILASIFVGGMYFATTYPINQAKHNLLNHRLDSAGEWLDTAGKIPFIKKSEIHFLMARLERRRGDYRAMSELLELASSEGYDGEMISRERILAAAQSADLDKAQPALSMLLADPRGDEREICEAYIIGFLQFQMHEAALQLIRAWQIDFPKDPRPHFLQGVIENSLHNTKEAEKCFHAALKIDPKYYAAAMDMAEVQLELKNTKSALQYLKLAEDDPLLKTDSYVAQAHCFRMLGQDQKAEKILRIVLTESPEHYAASTELGRILVENRRYADALPYLQALVDKDPLLTDPRQFLAQALRGMDRLEEAQAHFDAVEEIKENLANANQLVDTVGNGIDSIDTRLEIADLFWNYGSEQEAMVWMRSAYQLSPRYLPTLKFMLKYYRSKLKDDPNLQEQVDRFEQEIAFSQAQTNRTSVPPQGEESQSTPGTPVLPKLPIEETP
ncbi:MAG: tetratricopeptide repeat protein [Planctomycetota bacterium]|nr:tetratricopeptide repeat protein [Planctomycetota bacterium]